MYHSFTWHCCNVFAGSFSRWNFITLRIQYTTVNYNQRILTHGTYPGSVIQLLTATLKTRPTTSAFSTELGLHLENLFYLTRVSTVMLPFHCCVTMETSQTHCYATVTATLPYKCHKPTVTQQQLSHYYGNATYSLLHNRNCYVTMET
jgi:hypothetical protein